MKSVNLDAMILGQIEARGIRHPRVLDAIRAVPRAAFVPEHLFLAAQSDRALPIGHQQTISQPFIVAKMTELLALEPEHTVLEVGTGSGYHAAVLSLLVDQVFSVEIVESLAIAARARLCELGYNNVQVGAGRWR